MEASSEAGLADATLNWISRAGKRMCPSALRMSKLLMLSSSLNPAAASMR